MEYDRRFETYGENFIFYDYKEPLNLPPDKLEKNSFDLVVADPPFLSDECLGKVAETIRYLAKNKVLLCTGQQRSHTGFNASEDRSSNFWNLGVC